EVEIIGIEIDASRKKADLSSKNFRQSCSRRYRSSKRGTFRRTFAHSGDVQRPENSASRVPRHSQEPLLRRAQKSSRCAAQPLESGCALPGRTERRSRTFKDGSRKPRLRPAKPEAAGVLPIELQMMGGVGGIYTTQLMRSRIVITCHGCAMCAARPIAQLNESRAPFEF